MSSRTFASLACLASIAVLSVACGFAGDDEAGGGGGEPLDQGPPGGPSGPPTTGGKWEGHESTDGCGRTTIEYRIVDEVCAGTDAPDYLEHFRAPIMRDGARIGDRMYAVDATHLWVLDVTDPTASVRTALLTGFGQPLAAAIHDERLLLAAGAEGLIIADVSSPDAPVRVQTVATDGPALDVFVDGDLAYVATGKAGLVVVRLGETASIVGRIPLPSFTAAVAVKGDVAYVAACESLITVDTSSGAVLGSTWVDGAVDADGVLIAPAKDVFVDDAGVFVAAGRYGAVRIDATDPTAPEVLGNCTLPTENRFYASGVRAGGDRLFVAGGEWGILPVPLDDPSSCTSLVVPDPSPLPPAPDPEEGAEGEECTTEPPWQVLPWQDVWLPPPPAPDPLVAGEDPLQTFPDGEVVYAFGDATRIGLRSVDVRLAAASDLEKVGRYEEPRLMTSIAAHGDRVLLVGPRGGLYQRDGASLAVDAESPVLARTAVDGVFLDDGRWALSAENPLRINAQGGAVVMLDSFTTALWPGTMSARGNEVVVGDALGAIVADVDGGFAYTLTSGRTAELPAAVLGFGADSEVIIAAPEWVDAVKIDADGAAIPFAAHGVFTDAQAVSFEEWRVALPRRLLGRADKGVIELATLGRHAGVALHSSAYGDASMLTALPPGEYVGLSAAGDRAYAVSLDRGTYRSQLVTLDVSGDLPVIIAVEAWTGMAAGVAATSAGVFVADRDVGVRIYDAADSGVSLAGVVDLAEVEQ